MGIFTWIKSWFGGGRKDRVAEDVKVVIADGERLSADLKVVLDGLRDGKPLDVAGQVDDLVVDANVFITDLLKAVKSTLGIPVANPEGILQDVMLTIEHGEELLADVLEIIIAIRTGNIFAIVAEAREIFVDIIGFIADIRKLIEYIRDSDATTTPITL